MVMSKPFWPLDNPPQEIVEAGQAIEKWFGSRGRERWKMGGIQAVVKDSPAMTLENLTDHDRIPALERALEYAINRADGRNYVLEGELINEPQMAFAKALLPHVRWKWKNDGGNIR
jgi:hypothetical protein